MSGTDRHIEDALPENTSPGVEVRIYRNGNPPTIMALDGMDEARALMALLNEQPGTRAEFVTGEPWHVEDLRERDPLPEDELEFSDDF